MAAPKLSLEDRFWSKVSDRSDPDACWVWIRQINWAGYGMFTIQRKGFTKRTFYAHRVAYELTHGAIPEGRFICHHCDNRPCVNPSHLFLGDVKANAEDSVSKGRQQFGERHYLAKLTDETARAILADTRTQEVIAKAYGIHQMTVSDLKRGVTWKHLHR